MVRVVTSAMGLCLTAGSHLFKHCWLANKDLLNLRDINDVRNGLLLFKPLEHAFDDSKICFEHNAADQTFSMLLIDQRLSAVTVSAPYVPYLTFNIG